MAAAIPELPDAAERERAATTFDRNVVVTAGAGTGKTRLVVDRLVNLLMRDPETKLTQIVALTFTNKAANELKLRLRERLESFLRARLESAPESAKDEEIHRDARALMDRYRLSKERLERRALDALRQIERSEIGTIHGFAATLLRLYPMQSGVDPEFVEDDGASFDRLFAERWDAWLGDELARGSDRAEAWKRALRNVPLDQIGDLAKSLASETVDLERLRTAGSRVPAPVIAWLDDLEKRAAALLGRHSDNRSNEKLLRAARGVLQKFLAAGERGGCEILPEEADALGANLNRKLKGWPEEDCDDAQEILRAARALCRVDDALMRELGELLIPFAADFREAFTREGFISFDGLLARARDLVRDHPAVREQLKRRYSAILIDEFQDTDPIQYEILIYLGEKIGAEARDWKAVELEPGKIFVVGDPKQSIYAFRRADIEAYLEVVENIFKAQDGVEFRLRTNFRSHKKILDVVNGVFERLIEPRAGLQPEYVAIEPAPAEKGGALAFRKVTLRKVRGGEEKLGAEQARRLEAESLARWLDEVVLGKAEIVDDHGAKTLVEARHVAILLRKLTDVHHYLEPLRRRGLRYVVEGEKHFYAVQEIIDAVNLLRAVDDPNDRLALVGVLRSPLGALTDAEIYELNRARLLDYRIARRSKGEPESSYAKVLELYGILLQLHLEIRSLPVGEAVARVFDRAPVRLLAAATFHGEQAVANLEKLRARAEIMGRDGLNTLKEVIARLGADVLEKEEEPESALAEENLDAIRILSIHKSKGLEFPVVVLAGCQAPPHPAGERTSAALQDWSSNLAGLRTESLWSLNALFVAEKSRRREEEEQKRLLYVAMTRAREHLMISAAPAERRGGSYLEMLEEALGAEIAAGEESRAIAAGRGTIDIEVVQETLAPPGRPRRSEPPAPLAIDWDSYARQWKRRESAREAALGTPIFLTPTLLKLREAEMSEALPERKKTALASELPLIVGELAHRFLESWNFAEDPAEFRAALAPFLDRRLDPTQTARRAAVERELEDILAAFFSSGAYRELSSAEIVGREVPLLIPWDGRIMEGVIDLLYEKDGRLFLADYKSDRVERNALAEAAARYHHQVEIYSEAARRVLKKDVAGFKLIFLRLGEAVEALITPHA